MNGSKGKCVIYWPYSTGTCMQCYIIVKLQFITQSPWDVAPEQSKGTTKGLRVINSVVLVPQLLQA